MEFMSAIFDWSVLGTSATTETYPYKLPITTLENVHTKTPCEKMLNNSTFSTKGIVPLTFFISFLITTCALFHHGTCLAHKSTRKQLATLDCSLLMHPTQTPDSAVIWMHGLGDNSQGFTQLLQNILPSNTMAIIPNAPKRSVTIFGGQTTQAWFNVLSSNTEDRKKIEDVAGLLESNEKIDELIEWLISQHGISHQRIILGGFSQGGAMSLLVGSQSKYILGGILCCSGFMPMRSKFEQASQLVSPQAVDTPLYIFHGDADQVLSHKFAFESFDWLEKGKKITQRKTYRGLAHSVSHEETKDIQNIIVELLSKTAQVEVSLTGETNN